jgi:type I restriction enzyme S subunit
LFNEHIISNYLNLSLNSGYFKKTQIEPELTQQCRRANFNGTKFKNSLIPLPPLNEQKRIVEKFEQLMGLCDELEVKLRKAREDSGKLMETVVKDLLDGAAA